MAEKTEQPTQKKLDEGVKKGQILKSRDLVVTAIILTGVLYLTTFFNFDFVTRSLAEVLEHDFDIDPVVYSYELIMECFKSFLLFAGLVILSTCLASWIQSRLRLATEAMKINLNAINPVTGFKRIFSLRTVKELVKAIMYVVLLSFTLVLYWNDKKKSFFLSIYCDTNSIILLWCDLLFSFLLYSLAALIIIILLDYLSEYFLFMKDMKMEKEEVKREYIEQEGNPELKSRRKQMHYEILSEQLKSDIDNSKMIIANPTHIAIGIYFRPDISPIPLVSVRETEQVALAVRNYAEKNKIPVITDKQLARKIYSTHKRYDYVCLEDLDKILNLIFWLEDVEQANRPVSSDNRRDFSTLSSGEGQPSSQDENTDKETHR